MGEQGGCHCSAVRYRLKDGAAPVHHALCHCTDCRKASGAPAVGWALFAKDDIEIGGEPASYRSSEHAERHFCVSCGTGLFYTNEAIFPGKIDIQSATLDNPDAFPLQAEIQVAERIGWMDKVGELPRFERYPG
uniref:GFA family protein n=1 Tax=uncultured Sphingomonas sp. TaxID=158754 RepID=UPI002600F5E1|nr:GFA family protein [uncultured Sphingomonas sp.]